MYYNPGSDVVFAGGSLEQIKPFKVEMDNLFLPNSIQLQVGTNDQLLQKMLPWLKNYPTEPDKLKVFVVVMAV